MKKLKMIKIALSAILLTGCADTTSSNAELRTYANTSVTNIFDTMYAYSETTTDTEKAAERFKQSEKMLHEYNDLYDIYNDYPDLNNLKTINDNAGIKPVKVSPKIIDLLLTAKKFYDYSDGEFDITIGSLLKVWHEYRTEGIKKNQNRELGDLPSEEELLNAGKHFGWDKIEIDETNATVYISDPEVSLDVGGIAKGYAAEMAAQSMMRSGMDIGYLNVGRNIRLIGKKADGKPWVIGVTDPSGEYPNGLLSVPSEEPVSVVTSGDYERFYIAKDGNSYSHIIDPSTMYPATYYHSVTIITEDSGAADCLSTTLFTLSVQDGKKVLQNYEADTGKKASAIWLMDPKKTQGESGVNSHQYFVTYTDDLADKIIFQN